VNAVDRVQKPSAFREIVPFPVFLVYPERSLSTTRDKIRKRSPMIRETFRDRKKSHGDSWPSRL
jgi:hypothetical protein